MPEEPIQEENEQEDSTPTEFSIIRVLVATVAGLLIIIVFAFIFRVISSESEQIGAVEVVKEDPFAIVMDQGEEEIVLTSSSPEASTAWEEVIGNQAPDTADEIILADPFPEAVAAWEEAIGNQAPDTADEIVLTSTSPEAVATWEEAIEEQESAQAEQ